jgi:hypothetical protein
LRYFRENQISHPGALTLKHVEDYFGWRGKRRGSQRTVGNRNTVIGEIKFLRMMMDHAVQQGYATENPAKKLVLEKEAAREKNLWEDHEIKLVSDALSQPDKRFGWMHVTFLMGYYQAVRINQCRVPLSRIDFRRHEIDYPGQILVDGKRVNLVQGGEGYVHRIDDEFYPILKEIVAHRRALGKTTLCDIPLLCGVEYRRFLNGLGAEPFGASRSPNDVDYGCRKGRSPSSSGSELRLSLQCGSTCDLPEVQRERSSSDVGRDSSLPGCGD